MCSCWTVLIKYLICVCKGELDFVKTVLCTKMLQSPINYGEKERGWQLGARRVAWRSIPITLAQKQVPLWSNRFPPSPPPPPPTHTDIHTHVHTYCKFLFRSFSFLFHDFSKVYSCPFSLSRIFYILNSSVKINIWEHFHCIISKTYLWLTVTLLEVNSLTISSSSLESTLGHISILTATLWIYAASLGNISTIASRLLWLFFSFLFSVVFFNTALIFIWSLKLWYVTS